MSDKAIWKSELVVATVSRLKVEEHMSVPPVSGLPFGRFASVSSSITAIVESRPHLLSPLALFNDD